jgi:hypothetical protein
MVNAPKAGSPWKIVNSSYLAPAHVELLPSKGTGDFIRPNTSGAVFPSSVVFLSFHELQFSVDIAIY